MYHYYSYSATVSTVKQPKSAKCSRTGCISKEEVKVATTKESQLHLLIDTPTAKIWRDSSDLAELALAWPSSAPEQTSSRLGKAGETLFQSVIVTTTSSMSLENQTYKNSINLRKRWVPAPPPTGSEATGGAEEGDRGGGAGRAWRRRRL